MIKRIDWSTRTVLGFDLGSSTCGSWCKRPTRARWQPQELLFIPIQPCKMD